MNVQSEGLGSCQHCGSPIMQAIGQPGIKGVCLGCQVAAQPKTGRTVVVRSESGEGTALGKVTLEEVEHTPGSVSALPKDPAAVRKAIIDKANNKGVSVPIEGPSSIIIMNDDRIKIEFTVQDLTHGGIVNTLLQLTYEAIDNMPPFKTLKETKKAIKLQEDIEKLLKQKEK